MVILYFYHKPPAKGEEATRRPVYVITCVFYMNRPDAYQTSPRKPAVKTSSIFRLHAWVRCYSYGFMDFFPLYGNWNRRIRNKDVWAWVWLYCLSGATYCQKGKVKSIGYLWFLFETVYKVYVSYMSSHVTIDMPQYVFHEMWTTNSIPSTHRCVLTTSESYSEYILCYL